MISAMSGEGEGEGNDTKPALKWVLALPAWTITKNKDTTQHNDLGLEPRPLNLESSANTSENSYLLFFGSVTCFILLQRLFWINIQFISHRCTPWCGRASPLRGTSHATRSDAWGHKTQFTVEWKTTHGTSDETENAENCSFHLYACSIESQTGIVNWP